MIHQKVSNYNSGNLVAWLQILRMINYAIFCPKYDTYVEPRAVRIKRWKLCSQLFTYAIMQPIFLVCNNDFFNDLQN